MTTFDIFDNADFRSAFNNATVHVERNVAGLPEIKWDDAFRMLDEDVKAGNLYGQKRYENGGFRILNAMRVPGIADAQKKLLEIFQESNYQLKVEGRSTHLYMNITTQDGTYWKLHQDTENVIFWNIKGKSRWTIYKAGEYEDLENVSDDLIDVDVILEPGDILYCPYGRPHKVEAITPRFGASLGFGELR